MRYFDEHVVRAPRPPYAVLRDRGGRVSGGSRGRGPNWIGVPAFVLVLIGVLVLVDVKSRQDLSRELLDNGIETVADAVRVELTGGTAVGSEFGDRRPGTRRTGDAVADDRGEASRSGLVAVVRRDARAAL